MSFVENLWPFALATYQKPEVTRLCLSWQHRYGADINLLLAAAWLAKQQKIWTLEIVADLERHCAGWRQYGLLPLRAVRCGMHASELYSVVKALELRAEHLQLVMIERWLVQRLIQPFAQPPLPVAGGSSALCVAANLGVYARSGQLTGEPSAAALSELLAAFAPKR